MKSSLLKLIAICLTVMLLFLNLSCGKNKSVEPVNDPTTITFEKTFGGSRLDVGMSVIETSDGNYVIAGTTESTEMGDSDIYLIKTDKSGNLIWEKNFGGDNDNHGTSVCETSDGGYIITGTTYPFGTSVGDVYLIKTDKSGNFVWEKTFGGAENDYGNSVSKTLDGGFILTGRTESYGAGEADIYLIKTDNNGNLIWEKTFGGTEMESGNSVRETSDGGFILTGSTGSSGAGWRDVDLIKIDKNGNLIWEKTFGGVDEDYGHSVSETSDNGYIITGATKSPGKFFADVYLIKTDNIGNLIWEKTFNGADYGYGVSVLEISDGGFMITGSTRSSESGGGVYLIKTDISGNLIWVKSHGEIYSARSKSISKTIDGGYVIAGYGYIYSSNNTNPPDVCLIKTDSEGNVY